MPGNAVIAEEGAADRGDSGTVLVAEDQIKLATDRSRRAAAMGVSHSEPVIGVSAHGKKHISVAKIGHDYGQRPRDPVLDATKARESVQTQNTPHGAEPPRRQ